MAREAINGDDGNGNSYNESVEVMTGKQEPINGNVGVKDQMPGAPTTVSKFANAGNGITAGDFVEVDIDEELFQFKSDDTPLMDMMLKAKKVTVESPIVEHYMIDEPRTYVTTDDAVTLTDSSISNGKVSLKLDVADSDKDLVRPFQTLLVHGVDGYDGDTLTPGKPLMLYVTGIDESTGNPIVRAVNGYKADSTVEYGKIPAIPSGTICTIMANAMYETQQLVEPDTFIPKPTQVILQKRGMTHIVSDYFNSQKKRIPFKDSIIAEQAIRTFKTRGNRTLWGGRGGHFKVNAAQGMGMQDVYFMEGLRWQFKRIYSRVGAWTYEEFIALAKMFFTGEDVPQSAIMLAGKNVLEQIQCIDFSKHPEVSIDVKHNPKLGWDVTAIHTVFGDIEIKREPTFERMGWSNSAALISPDRLVHYQRTTEHTFDEKIDGQEARRSGVIVWDALALKGCCHMWIDGDSMTTAVAGDQIVNLRLWTNTSKPTINTTSGSIESGAVNDGDVLYFTAECDLGGGVTAHPGDMYQAVKGGTSGAYTLSFVKYNGSVLNY